MDEELGDDWDEDDQISWGFIMIYHTPDKAFVFTDDGQFGNVEQLAFLFQEFLRAFPLRTTKVLHCSWADTSSRHEPDSYGGGAFAVTANAVRWMSSHDFINKQKGIP